MAFSSEDALENWENLAPLSIIHSSEDDFDLMKTFTNEAAYVGKKLTTNISVPANIHKMEFRNFWINTLKPSEFVMKTIMEGYELPFKTIPPPFLREKQCQRKTRHGVHQSRGEKVGAAGVHKEGGRKAPLCSSSQH